MNTLQDFLGDSPGSFTFGNTFVCEEFGRLKSVHFGVRLVRTKRAPKL